MEIILGSSSRWRKRVLTEMGYDFSVMSPDIDEKSIRLPNPSALCLKIALAKTEALLTRLNRPAILITADQVTVCNGELREKPVDVVEARSFLESYAVHPVETYSAVVVTNTKTGWDGAIVDVAKVWFKPFSREVIDVLLAQGDVFDCAGGFASGMPIFEEHVISQEGPTDSVMGLPKELTRLLIEDAMAS